MKQVLKQFSVRHKCEHCIQFTDISMAIDYVVMFIIFFFNFLVNINSSYAASQMLTKSYCVYFMYAWLCFVYLE